MTWFKRHLNWTLVIAAVVTNGLGFVLGALEAHITTSLVTLYAALAIYLATFVWVLVQKGRGLWLISLAFIYLGATYILGFIVFIPLIFGSLPGFIMLLCLKNKRIP